jgi:hypothetical protein
VQVILDALAYRQEQRSLKIYAFCHPGKPPASDRPIA